MAPAPVPDPDPDPVAPDESAAACANGTNGTIKRVLYIECVISPHNAPGV